MMMDATPQPDTPPRSLPLVSVIVPCYNEEDTIGLLLDALYRQTYPLARMEVIIADGLSQDATRARIAAFVDAHPALQVRVVDNPRRVIPAALNRALEAARGEVIVRMDAHALPASDYVARCVQALQEGRGDNVGGVWDIVPRCETRIARAIARAAAHPLGVGDAWYRLGGTARAVDTVPFGAFFRTLVDRIGRFDESLLTNEDYEFNTRIREAGGRVWLDPTIRSRYFARATLRDLARQYARYGYWKAQMIRRYPHTLRWRQALPPLFVLTLLVLAWLAPWSGLARSLLALQMGGYLLVLLVASLPVAWRARDAWLGIGVPLAIATMHLSWGAAFLWGLVSGHERR